MIDSRLAQWLWSHAPASLTVEYRHSRWYVTLRRGDEERRPVYVGRSLTAAIPAILREVSYARPR